MNALGYVVECCYRYNELFYKESSFITFYRVTKYLVPVPTLNINFINLELDIGLSIFVHNIHLLTTLPVSLSVFLIIHAFRFDTTYIYF